MKGIEVGVDEILLSREKRVAIQNELIKKYNVPVISFTMNIPGSIKTNAAIKQAFDIGKNTLLNDLRMNFLKKLEIREINENTGNELFISVDGPAEKIKNIAIAIEESSELGRLFDIDVIDVNFEKLSRKSFRKCLICEEQAQECGRSRKHSIEELQKKVEEILKNKKMYELSIYYDASVYYIENGEFKIKWIDSMIGGTYAPLTADETLEFTLKRRINKDSKYIYFVNTGKDFILNESADKPYDFQYKPYIYFEKAVLEICPKNIDSPPCVYLNSIDNCEQEELEKYFEKILRNKIIIISDEWRYI